MRNKARNAYNPFKDYWAWIVYGLFFGCVVLNAIIRPTLAKGLGGEQIRRGASVRGSDRWWIFDDATRRDHPWLTDFLTWSDGQIAMACLGLIAILLMAGWLTNRLKGRGRQKR